MKLLLNSFWGKFGQNNNKKTTLYIKDYAEWIKIMCDAKYKVSSVDFSIENTAVVQYSIEDESFETNNFNTNVVIASFVTTYARLKLFKEMKRLGQRVIYHDTDSLIYYAKDGDYEPELGNYLGDLTNEISTEDGGYITEICCPGPKNYAYKTASGKTKCVVKGFSMNHQALLSLNFNVIKDLVLKKSDSVREEEQEPVLVNHLRFRRENHQNKTDIFPKIYNTLYNKRIVVNDGTWRTYAYGYKF